MHEITISQAWAWILGAASAFLLICNAVERIVATVKIARAPEAKQREEINRLKADVADIKEKLQKDKEALEDSNKANHITQEALLALLEHGLNGNNVEQMTKAKDKLHDYLINH